MAEYLNEKVMEVRGHQKSSYMHQIESYFQYFSRKLYADERNGLLRELLCEHLMCMLLFTIEGRQIWPEVTRMDKSRSKLSVLSN